MPPTRRLPFLKCALRPEAYSSGFLHDLTAKSPLWHPLWRHLSKRVARSESIYRIGAQLFRDRSLNRGHVYPALAMVRRLHKVHAFLAVLAELTPEMHRLRGLLTDIQGRFPSRRTWERRLATIPDTLPAQIGCLG